MDYFLNPSGNFQSEHYQFLESNDALKYHESLESYAPTPIVSLPDIADEMGIKSIMVKDESKRFGLDAFKGLGASYAINQYLQKSQDNPTFCTATDGNHGRAVAWAARMAECKAVIYVPIYTSTQRIDHIKNEGAKVVVVNGDYDRAVERAYSDAERRGMKMIQDTAWEGYTEIPQLIMAGYTTMFHEIERVSDKDLAFDIVLLQAGVGSFAASAVWYFQTMYGEKCPKLVCVEPQQAGCILRSFQKDRMVSIDTGHTIMAGLNCGTPSSIAWEILKTGISVSMAISDSVAKQAVRLFYHSNQQIISGESGAAGLGGLIALLNDEKFKKAKKWIDLDKDSRVLVFSTEGDTDNDSFQRIINN